MWTLAQNPRMHSTQWSMVIFTTLIIVHVSGESCKQGFHRDTSGNCTLCTTNCFTCKSLTECLICTYGHFESSGTCIECKQIENCTKCNNKGCIQCDNGFTPHSGECETCDDPNCSKCSGVGALCTSCKQGYYFDNDKCTQCKIAYCQDCINDDKCRHCSAGSYLHADKCHRCKADFCKECKGANGDVCTACSDGYFAESQGQCTKCNETCFRCSSRTECSICADGYYLDNRVCLACHSRCKRCNSAGHCEECRSGFWGQACNESCSVNCVEEKCSMASGRCYHCQPGNHGDRCEERCNNTCRNGTCARSGVCNGCDFGNYGDLCEKPCVKANCVNSECYQMNGTCIDHCPKRCFSCKSNSTCDQCKTDLYGPNCLYNCSSCINKACKRDRCTWGCKDGFYSLGDNVCKQCPSDCTACTSADVCTGCVSGKYGDTCQLDCDTMRCLSCDKAPTNCIECKPGYVLVGNTCCNENCSTCDSKVQGLCLTCPDGFYGDVCGGKCEGFCKSCNTSGSCTECGVSRFNSKSKLEFGLCTCYHNQCDARENFACNACKKPGWYTHEAGCCPCSKNCKHTVQCTNKTGECTDGCKSGWWGSQCDQRCQEPCLECTSATCTRCNPGYHGNQCQHTCSYNCFRISNRPVCDINTGQCSHGCTNGTWGPSCESPCDPRCLNVWCNRTSGACSMCSGSFCGADDSFLSSALIGGVIGAVLIIAALIAVCLIRRRNLVCLGNKEETTGDLPMDETEMGMSGNAVEYEDVQERSGFHNQLGVNDTNCSPYAALEEQSTDNRTYSELQTGTRNDHMVTTPAEYENMADPTGYEKQYENMADPSGYRKQYENMADLSDCGKQYENMADQTGFGKQYGNITDQTGCGNDRPSGKQYENVAEGWSHGTDILTETNYENPVV